MFVPVMEINHIQGTVDKSVNISDRISGTYHGLPPAPGSTRMGLLAHIFRVGRALLAALNLPADAARELDRRTGLWRQSERKLIDRQANLAEHPLQSGRFCEIHMTITGMRQTSGT